MDTFKKRLWMMRSRLGVWCKIVTHMMEQKELKMIMVGLTYKNASDWKSGHVGEFMKSVKQKLGEKLHAFAWVAELQKRGAVHYHVVMIVDKKAKLPMPDKSNMWKWGSSNIMKVKSPWYLVTYVGKEYQKDLEKFPKGLRMYAVSLRGSTPPVDADDSFYTSPPDGVGEWRYVAATVTKHYAVMMVPPDTITDVV